MSSNPESPVDRLWREYLNPLVGLDDLSLARWMSQTLGQLHGKAWRMSHPLMGLYRLMGQIGHERGVWLKRLATIPGTYTEASCCRAPLLPLFTRDVIENGLICQHCGETAIAFEDFPEELRDPSRTWAQEYDLIHSVAHWDEIQRKRSSGYESELEKAAKKAERMLNQARLELIPTFLDHYPTVVWEDHDECLEVRPEDIYD